MLYNGVELPIIPTYDEVPYCMLISPRQVVYSNVPLVIYPDKLRVNAGGSFGKRGVRTLTDGVWTGNEFTVSSSATSYAYTVAGPFWANHDIYDSSGNLFLAASIPVDPNTLTGTLEIQSSQILDDSASFVVSVSDLASTESIYSIKAVLSSAGTEVKSTVTDTFAGTSSEMHLTVANLEPETAYDISFILQKNGTDTTITASTSFTTLAGSGAGEGETPDYTGQLNEIQISVDNVGTKLDGVQETLTETKEEITSLPEKIATSITEGVKGLFIPSPEDLTELFSKYDALLQEKLGFVFQSVSIFAEFAQNVQTNLESGEAYEFTFPGVKVPINGEEFVFIAETPVSLENELMDVLRPVLGTIVSIICVSAFVNMAHDYALAIISGISAYEFERRKD